jgi:hypothetical protein
MMEPALTHAFDSTGTVAVANATKVEALGRMSRFLATCKEHKYGKYKAAVERFESTHLKEFCDVLENAAKLQGNCRVHIGWLRHPRPRGRNLKGKVWNYFSNKWHAMAPTEPELYRFYDLLPETSLGDVVCEPTAETTKLHEILTDWDPDIPVAESRQQEREWQKFQLDGELDDARLVDGVAGERHVYRKRGIKQPDIGAPQRLPKRVRFVFDLSGSMYRFNGEDGRLDRSLEAVTMFMEALQGFDHKILYSIVGHSGDSECIELVEYGKPPTNKKDRFKVLQTMFAHAQYCSSGDETLNGATFRICDRTFFEMFRIYDRTLFWQVHALLSNRSVPLRLMST